MRGDPAQAFGVRAVRLCAASLALLAAGCARGPEPERPRQMTRAPLAVQVYADTGRGERLAVRAPAARAWLARVSPDRAPLPAPEFPEPQADSLPFAPDPGPPLEVDPGLKPPVLRGPARLVLSSGSRRAGSVDLDVRVDEAGTVTDVQWAGGATDTTLIVAARRCALGMRFYPALRGGRPVAVWCRQRFDLGGAAR